LYLHIINLHPIDQLVLFLSAIYAPSFSSMMRLMHSTSGWTDALSS
jgi:hypothetical protein